MVRGKGPSKSCTTCLQRKKGCDKQRPSCGQCRKACVPCQGYNRLPKFHNYSPDSGGQPSILANRSVSELGTQPAVALHQSLANSAYTTKIIGQFWQIYQPRGRQLSLQLMQNSIGGIFHCMQTLLSQNDILRKAALALCMSTIVWQDNQADMRQSGRRYYFEALHGMAKALGQYAGDGGLALLATTRLFGFYEAIHGADEGTGAAQVRSWMAHNAGGLALIRGSHPSFYVEGLAHRLFVDGRLLMTVNAIRVRKATFLRETQWMEIPWSLNPKTPRDRIVDVLVEVPTLLQATDAERFSPCETEFRPGVYKKHLTHFFLGLQSKLDRWQAENCAIISLASRFPPLWDTNVSDFELQSEDIVALHVTSIYWAVHALLSTTKRGISDIDGSLRADTSVEEACGKIVGAVSCILHPCTGLFRNHLVTIPLGIVLYLMQDPSFKHEAFVEARQLLVRCLIRPECSSISRLLGNLGCSSSAHKVLTRGETENNTLHSQI